MGSVKEEITRLETAKKDIETAIETCGVDVPNTELIDTYASYIRQIPSAVFSGLNVDPVGGSDQFIQSIKQTNGLIEATVGGLVSTSNSGLVPKADGNAGVINNQSDDYVLTYKGGTIDWYKLPANAFKNDDNNTTYTLSGTLNGNAYDVTLTPSSGNATGVNVPAMGAASSNAAGTAGLVPAPAKNKHNSFLRGDGTWAVPDNTTYSVMTGATASAAGTSGLVPQPAKGDQGKFLSGAGTWTALPSLSITDSESGNAVTDVEVSGHGITLKRGTTFSVNGHKHSSDDITALTSYVKATAASAIASTDSLNTALGKLELKADTAYTLTAGAYDGDGTIENLAEILKVLEGISDTDTIQAIVGKYLPLAGGMMSGNITFDVNRMIRWHQSDSYSISCPTGSDGAYFLLKAHNGTTVAKRLSIYKTATSLPNTAYNLYTDGSLYAASATFGAATITGGSDLTLQASSTQQGDAGDIVFKDYSGSELGRIWLDSTANQQLSLRYGANDAAKRILHSGNSSVSKSGETLTVKINGVEQSITNSTYTTLPNPYNISFKDTSNNTVNYNGSSALDLTGGIYYAATSNTATAMSSFTEASNEATWRYVWMSWNDNSGKPTYSNKLKFQTSTGTLSATTFSGNLSGHATSARYISCPDTRSAAITPKDLTADPTGVSFDFKSNSVTGLTAAYAGVMTFRPYSSSSDWTGGPAHNLAFDANGLHHRTSKDDTTWNSWKKLAYTSEIPTKVSQLTNDGGFVTGGPYLPLAGGSMDNAAVVTFTANGTLRQTTATTSNATSIVEWYKGTTKDSNYTHPAQIGWHNTGNTDGAIYLVPYPTNTDPWASSVGLYIGKTALKWNNQGLIHSGNIGDQSVAYATSAGNADTVDNKHASDFVYSISTGDNFDCNTIGTHPATYRLGNTPANAFSNASWSNLLVIGGGDTMTQLGCPYNSDALYFRRGTWYADGTGSIKNNAWKSIIHEGNFNSYAPKLDGTGATGTWAIDISGKASTITIGTGTGDAYRAIVVTNGSNSLFTAGTGSGKPQYNYSTGDVKAYSFTTDGGNFNGNVTGTAGSTAVWASSAVSTNLDTVENRHGWANSSGSVTNLPTSVSAGTLVSFSNSSSKLQFFGGYKTTHGLHYRKWYSSSWESWRTILDSSNWTSFISIPSVGNGTVTINQGGASKGSFTLNQSTAATIDLNDTNYYPNAFSWTGGTTLGPTGSLTGVGMSPVSFGAIPAASASASGIVTTAAQPFAGQKTFRDGIRVGYSSSDHSSDKTKIYFGDGSYVWIGEEAEDDAFTIYGQDYVRINTKLNNYGTITSSTYTTYPGVICDSMYLKSAAYHIGTVTKLQAETAATTVTQGYGIPGVTISQTASRIGKRAITITNSSGFRIFVHAPNLSALFLDKGGGSCIEHGFAYIQTGTSFPYTLSRGSSLTFYVIYGYVHTQGSWNTGDFTKSNDLGGFTCSVYASRYF